MVLTSALVDNKSGKINAEGHPVQKKKTQKVKKRAYHSDAA